MPLSYFLFLLTLRVFKASNCTYNHYRSRSFLRHIPDKTFCVIFKHPSGHLIPSHQYLQCAVQPHGMHLSAFLCNAIHLKQSPSANRCQIWWETPWVTSPLSMARLCTSPRSTLTTSYLFTPQTTLYLFHYMSQSSESTLQALFNAALQNYKDKTGTGLVDHPFAERLETCQSVSSITEILQEQAQSFREFKENDGKLMKALSSSVDVLCSPTINSTLSQAIGLVVCRNPFICLPCSHGHSTAIPACECDIHWHWHPTGRMSIFLRAHLQIPLTYNSFRPSTKHVLATMPWLTFSSPSTTF